MAEYGFKKLSSVDTEDSFSSETSKHIIVEDGGSIKRLDASALSPEPFIVTFTSDGGVISSNKTPEEIFQAFLSGKHVVGTYSDIYIPLSGISGNESQVYYIVFSSLVLDGDNSVLLDFAITYGVGEEGWQIIEV